MAGARWLDGEDGSSGSGQAFRERLAVFLPYANCALGLRATRPQEARRSRERAAVDSQVFGTGSSSSSHVAGYPTTRQKGPPRRRNFKDSKSICILSRLAALKLSVTSYQYAPHLRELRAPSESRRCLPIGTFLSFAPFHATSKSKFE